MSERLTLAAVSRTQTGKNANRKLRDKGVTPAVFYNAGGKSRPVQVQEAALAKLYGKTGQTTVFDLELDEDGEKTVYPCLIWDVEYYPTKNRFQHVDFYGVDLEKELKVRVPLEFSGTAKGAKLGGKLEIYRDQIHILSKPASLPRKIIVDISGLDVGEGLRIADIAMPENVRASYEVNYAVITVTMPGGKESEEGADETAGA